MRFRPSSARTTVTKRGLSCSGGRGELAGPAEDRSGSETPLTPLPWVRHVDPGNERNGPGSVPLEDFPSPSAPTLDQLSFRSFRQPLQPAIGLSWACQDTSLPSWSVDSVLQVLEPVSVYGSPRSSILNAQISCGGQTCSVCSHNTHL